MRPTIVLLMIASLLSCPLWCANATDCADPASAVASSDGCCGHCQTHRQEAETPPAPAEPCNDCQCSTCLCNGAVFESDEARFHDQLLIVWNVLGDYLARQANGAEVRCATREARLQTADRFSGRDARIRLRSLLI